MWWDGWDKLGTVLLTGVISYLILVLFLRVSGKRTLSKMNAFDFVVTVALGSTLAATMLDVKVTVADGAAAFLVLVGGQYAITWLSVRSDRFQTLIKAEPTLLVRDGRMIRSAMRRQRVSEEELLAEVRQAGHVDLRDVAAVILETNSDLSVLGEIPEGEIGRSSLRTVPALDDGTEIG